MTTKKQNFIAFIVGAIMLLIVLGVVMFKDNPSPSTFFVIRVLLALAGASFASILPGFLNIENPIVKAGGPLAVAVLIYLIDPPLINSTSSVKGIVLVNGRAEENVSVTVLGNTEYTNNSGNFEIKDKGINKEEDPLLSFDFEYHSPDPGYEVIDTTIIFETDAVLNKSVTVNLIMHPVAQPEKVVEGHVWDMNEHPVEGVKISAGDATTQSNGGGFFSMKIKTHEKNAAITFEKPGYQTRTLRFYIPNKDISIALTK